MMLLHPIAVDPGAVFGSAKDHAPKGPTVRRSYRGEWAVIADNKLTDFDRSRFDAATTAVRREGVQCQAQESARCRFVNSLLGSALHT